MYSDAVVGNVLSIWSRLHLTDVSLLIFYLGDLPIDKSWVFFSYYYSGTRLSCRSGICFMCLFGSVLGSYVLTVVVFCC